MRLVDFRSDTVTQPTPAMREAMAKAVVGDDVYHDDPTVNALQELAAAKVGKEAGLFVPSGTMGNLAAILAHCGRGDEVIMGKHSHTFLYEGGGISTLGGIHSSQIPELPDGSLDLNEVEANIRPPEDDHEPVTRLIEIENTHNRCGGVYQTPETVRRLADFAHARGLIVHMDGARLFNSAVAQKVDAHALTAAVDSVTFCLSKGLCAPVGSVLCGSREFIAHARKIRKHLGGGMRQAGILAAAGIVALETMVERLVDDHARAARLAEGIQKIPSLRLWPGMPATNMVFFDFSPQIQFSDHEIEQKMEQRGVLMHASNPRRFRLVTHYWIDDAAVATTLSALNEVFGLQ
ncbi:MAG: low-specificity L-threonine aldolase [Anaerolineae bacterium CG_4_9_14_3_um_filter_57_17]|nr:low-specificity L-threonine aldolase [bacterium]NCT21023.1 low-specificity L-threonine aldolase [bacterium]OIO83308.1 MAG: threonine aldolase [Anaerolineae bacterium CG2_30_57_67]PJB67846.1 MAG: low-specificity L-threonine aldolase [Anaerolineae bacterium CG_4_9_14_3_um_filter_57_17]